MRIALYKRNDYILVNEAKDWLETDPDYIRITEIVDIELPTLPAEVLIPKELAQLDVMEKALTDKHLKSLEAIQTKRKDLLALAPPELVEKAHAI